MATVPVQTFNVKDQGAKGDGTTDDTAAIQAALDAAKAAGRGSKVFIPEGTYIVSAPAGIDTMLWINGGGITVYGQGQNSILKVAPCAYNTVFYLVDGAESANFHDFRVDQNPVGNAANPVGIAPNNLQSVITGNNL